MTTALVVFGAVVALIAAYALGRRKRPTIYVDTAGKKYELLVNGRTEWAGDDSREASQMIEAARTKSVAWQLLVDGVEKKRG